MIKRGLLLILIAWVPLALADECDDIEANLMSQQSNELRILLLGRMVDAGCLGGTQDDWPFAATLEDRIHELRLEPAKVKQRYLRDWLEQLARRADQRRSEAANPNIEAAFDRLATTLRDTADTLGEPGARLTHPTSWRPNENLNTPAIDVTVKATFIEVPCAESAVMCEAALNNAMTWLAISTATSRVLLTDIRAGELDLADELTLLDNQWNAYFTQARPQMPWELYINAWLYDRRKADDYCTSEGGFCGPPAHQWIVLHPDIALEYLDDNPEGSRVAPAVTLEVLGYHRWNWDGAAMTWPIGASLIASLSDRAGVDPLGVGALFHWNTRWSIGIVRHDDETGVLIGLNLLPGAQGDPKTLRSRF